MKNKIGVFSDVVERCSKEIDSERKKVAKLQKEKE
jgi:hypothetical protein